MSKDRAQTQRSPQRQLSTEVGRCNEEALRKVIQQHFKVRCTKLVEINRGSFHKILHTSLDTYPGSDTPTEVIARIAFPVFPCDKIESEVATLKALEERTSVPVPHVYFWCSDANNIVEAEYIVMSKIGGVDANKLWKHFDFDTKAHFMTQLSHYLSEIFTLRFDKIGSLYLDSLRQNVEVGPVVCTTLFSDPQGEEGRPYVTNTNRGPFQTAGQWLSSIPQHELAFMAEHRDFALSESINFYERDTIKDFQRAHTALERLSDIALSYCGPLGPLSNEFTLHHHDFRLTNVHADPVTGSIVGLLDWEATHTAPLWACARMPHWIMDETEAGDSYITDRPERAKLRSLFLENVSPEWRDAFEKGKDWRIFQATCEFNWIAWGQEKMMNRLEAYKVQADCFPGVPLQEEELEEDDLISGNSDSDELQLTPLSSSQDL